MTSTDKRLEQIEASICHGERPIYSDCEWLISQVRALREALGNALVAAREHIEGCLYCGGDVEYVNEHGESSPEHRKECWCYKARALLAGAPVCVHCGAPATCLGRYESMTVAEYACDECCGHACEDGHCDPLAGKEKK